MLFLIFLYQSSSRVSHKKLSFCCWTKVAKNIISFWKKPLFLFFDHFCKRFIFSCIVFKNILPLLFFQCLWKSILILLSQSLCFCSKKKHLKKILILFILWLLSLLLLCLISTLFLCFLFSLTMFPLLVVCCRYVYLLSFFCLFTLYHDSSSFFLKKHLYLFFFSFFSKTPFFSFVHRFLWNCFGSISIVVSPFFLLFFSIVFVRAR